jgi:hypothetical protein
MIQTYSIQVILVDVIVHTLPLAQIKLVAPAPDLSCILFVATWHTWTLQHHADMLQQGSPTKKSCQKTGQALACVLHLPGTPRADSRDHPPLSMITTHIVPVVDT